MHVLVIHDKKMPLHYNQVPDWLARVEARPSYATAVTAWAPAPLVDLFRKHGEAVWGEVEQIARARAAVR